MYLRVLELDPERSHYSFIAEAYDSGGLDDLMLAAAAYREEP